MAHVLLTDHPWPDIEIERQIIEGAGHLLFAGPMEAKDSLAIEAMVESFNPEAILTCWAQVSERAIAMPDHLAIVARIGVGLDNISVAAATSRGAWVTNVPDYCVSEVSDHALALLLSALRGVTLMDRTIKARGWHVPDYVAPRLEEITVGVLGYGRIGRVTARKLQALGCRVLVYVRGDPVLDPEIERAGLDQMQQQAQVMVLHLPLSLDTTHIIDREFIEGCVQRPLIVNVSRGGLVDNDALIWGLDNGLLRGAALDVVEGEPSPPQQLLSRQDVVVTPHVAYSSDASLAELRRRACEDVVRVLAGDAPRNPCNEPTKMAHGTALPSGVSSDIRVVTGPNGPEVVKRALNKLKVRDDWFADPARSETEVRALRTARELLGADFVPQVLWSKPEEHSFGMELVNGAFRNWKQELLDGRIDPRTAKAAGIMLGRLHSSSAAASGIAIAFDDRTHFRELRIEPFFEGPAAKNPDVADAIMATASSLWQRRSALVHGDFSPKNILADGDRVVLLDWEVAHWGDPRFDLGFLLAHLLLKATRAKSGRETLLESAQAVLDGYAQTGQVGIEDADLARVTACLMLARTDGKSPVDYLNELAIDVARRLGKLLLTEPEQGVRPFLASFSRIVL